jgi:uncharacterized cofD-like protein
VNVVGIGGGHGLSRALAALRQLDIAPTAIVTVADDGGSSGRLREQHGVIALGDMRRALHTLARQDDLAGLFDHRFQRGELEGHALGNLLLLGLLERCGGDVVAGLDRAAALLGCAGRVLPCTVEPVQLRARVGGRDVAGQVRVATAAEPVERVWLEPAEPEACAEAVAALVAADLVVLGPGSLFTSIIAALLVPGIAQALARTAARTVLVANLLTQQGETAEFDAKAHVDALLDHVPGLRLDAVVLHDGPPPIGPGRPLGAVLAHPATGRVLAADVAARRADGSVAGVHDPHRLAGALRPMVAPG